MMWLVSVCLGGWLCVLGAGGSSACCCLVVHAGGWSICCIPLVAAHVLRLSARALQRCFLGLAACTRYPWDVTWRCSNQQSNQLYLV
jgi:hypothetical protein